jgi:hypothetical protein
MPTRDSSGSRLVLDCDMQAPTAQLLDLNLASGRRQGFATRKVGALHVRLHAWPFAWPCGVRVCADALCMK